MRDIDAAESNLASYKPEEYVEDPIDVLADAIIEGGGTITPEAKANLARAYKALNAESSFDVIQIAVEIAYALAASKLRRWKILGHILLIAIKKHPWSGEKVGKFFGLSRAAINKQVTEFKSRQPDFLTAAEERYSKQCAERAAWVHEETNNHLTASWNLASQQLKKAA
ncbi:MAG TPA: hypothetical protein VIM61_09320 [Chthoniobacterales bacterium]